MISITYDKPIDNREFSIYLFFIAKPQNILNLICAGTLFAQNRLIEFHLFCVICLIDVLNYF